MPIDQYVFLLFKKSFQDLKKDYYNLFGAGLYTKGGTISMHMYQVSFPYPSFIVICHVRLIYFPMKNFF